MRTAHPRVTKRARAQMIANQSRYACIQVVACAWCNLGARLQAQTGRTQTSQSVSDGTDLESADVLIGNQVRRRLLSLDVLPHGASSGR